MKTARRLLVIFGKSLLVFLIVAVLYGIAAFSLSRITVNDNPKRGEIAIYLRSNGVHTDIVVPAKTEIHDWTQQIVPEHIKAGQTAEYLAFGWGDRDFYLNTPTWAELKFSTAFNAAFYLGTAIVHTEYEHNLVESAQCKKIMISGEDYRKLADYISGSFKTDENGNVLWIAGSGYGKDDTFYEAKGKYSLFKTCNTWTNSSLKAAGQKAAFWTVTDTGLLCHYQ